MTKDDLNQFTCPRCAYQGRRLGILDMRDWLDEPDQAVVAYCPSCRFYGPPAIDAEAAAALFIEGDFSCEFACQDCGLLYPGSFRRTVCIEDTVWRINCCARCYLREDLWVPRPQDSLPDDAYEAFLAKGERYEDGPFYRVPMEALRPIEELRVHLEAEREKNQVN